MHLRASLLFRYKLEVVRNGRVVARRPWRANMITDVGMNGIGTGTWSLLSGCRTCSLGNAVSPTPVRRDTTPNTISQAGNTVTASAAFFSAADVGRLIKFGAGSAGAECYVTAYVSPTEVTVSTSATIAAQVGTVWYVNQANLDSPLALTWLALTGGSTRTVVGNVVSNIATVVHTSNALAANADVSEVGFGTTTGTGLFDRDIVSPPVGLVAGDQARVTVQYTQTYDVTQGALANFATGWNTAGNFGWETFRSSLAVANNANSAIPELDASGIERGGRIFSLIASAGANIALLSTAQAALSAFNISGTGARTTLVQASSVANSAYATGSFYRDKVHTWNTATANGSIYGVAIWEVAGAAGSYGALIFTAAQTKLNTQVVTITTRISWARVLVN